MARGENFVILASVELDTSTIQKQLDNIGKNLKGINIDVKADGAKNATTSINQLSQATLDASGSADSAGMSYQALNEVWQTSASIIGAMVEQVYEMDSSLTEFRKVSDLGGQALDDYVDKLNDLGSTVARTGSEMLDAATSFRKNGYNDEDAAQLAQISSMFQNIADEQISAGESADFIISQLIAFNKTADDAMRVIDQINEVSNNYSVSSADLAQGLSVVASTSAAMGNSMEETLGIIAY